jgi:hypothetical protein
VRLWLGVAPDRHLGFDRLACFEPETGLELGDYTKTRAELAEARELAEAERRRADEEQRRADEERRRAEDAIRARAEADARIRELEAELKRYRGRKS